MSFGVLDVDVSAEGGVVSTQLGLQQLPTYVIYQGGQEVARLSSSPDRRKLGEVLAQHAAAAAAAAVAAATAATKQQQ
jgi:thioredoxin-like negative regulator of GroEL